MHSIPVEPSELKRRGKQRTAILRRNVRLLASLGFVPAPSSSALRDDDGARIWFKGYGLCSHYRLSKKDYTGIDVRMHEFTTAQDVIEIMVGAAWHDGHAHACKAMRQALGFNT